MKTLTEHWNEIFKKTDEKKLGWYEDDYSQIESGVHADSLSIASAQQPVDRKGYGLSEDIP